MTPLPRIRTDLLKHPLDKQLLVYDTRWDQVHLIDQTTACVMQLLEEGGWTREGITSELAVRLGIDPNPDLLPLALEQLHNTGLLDVPAGTMPEIDGVSRREMLGRLAMAGAAALAIPAVASLTATSGYAQGTTPKIGIGGTCTSNGQCISGNCCNGSCIVTGGTCAPAGSVPNGGACGADNQCSTAGASCTSGVCKGPTGSACTTAAGCQSNTCCGSQCRPAGCSTSTATGSCTGASVPPGNAAIGPDAACCSGSCQRQGNSSNYNCTATTCT
jgi:hypothetical protein